MAILVSFDMPQITSRSLNQFDGFSSVKKSF